MKEIVFKDYPDLSASPVRDYLFLCSVPEISSRSVTHIRIYGTPTTGDEAIDQTLRRQAFTTYINITRMLNYFQEGITVRVHRYADTEQIYQLISGYLLEWKRYLNTEVNLIKPPFEELILLDQLANTVYEHAKFQFTRESVESMYPSYAQTRPSDPYAIQLKPNTPMDQYSQRHASTRVDPKDTQYESMAEHFKGRAQWI